MLSLIVHVETQHTSTRIDRQGNRSPCSLAVFVPIVAEHTEFQLFVAQTVATLHIACSISNQLLQIEIAVFLFCEKEHRHFCESVKVGYSGSDLSG